MIDIKSNGIYSCKAEALELLKKIISFNTVNPPGNEKPLAGFFANYLKDSVDNVIVDDIANNRSNIIAVVKGKGNKKALVLNGHMDTVPFGDVNVWHYSPTEAVINGSRLYGRGASDMKSGLAAMLYAFKRFSVCNKQPEGDIIFIATADEESYGSGARNVLKKRVLENAGVIIIGEPTGNSIALASKGAIWLKFRIFGRASHGAYPQEGINAIDIAYELAEAIRKYVCGFAHRLLTEPTCTITEINGGTKVNMVPEGCEISIDIRTVPALDHECLYINIEKAILELKGKYKGLEIVKQVLNNRFPVETKEEEPTVKMLFNIVRQVTGKEPQFTGTSYFSDASIFNTESRIPTVLFGPGLADKAHKTDEYVNIEDFYTALQCYEKLIFDY